MESSKTGSATLAMWRVGTSRLSGDTRRGGRSASQASPPSSSGLRVDIIMTVGAAATDAATKATKTIPIVGVAMGTPVQQGFVAGLPRPGGNVSGLATQR